MILSASLESAELRSWSGHVPTCLICISAHVSTYLACLRAHVPTWLACLRVHVPTCRACLCLHVPTCLACLRAHMPTHIACLRDQAPTCLACLRAHMSTWLAYLRAHVSTCLPCLHAHKPTCLTCERAQGRFSIPKQIIKLSFMSILLLTLSCKLFLRKNRVFRCVKNSEFTSDYNKSNVFYKQQKLKILGYWNGDSYYLVEILPVQSQE